MQRQLCVARSARSRPRGVEAAPPGGRIIIICKQANKRVRARGASRDRAPLAAAAAASTTRAPVRRRTSPRTHARRSPPRDATRAQLTRSRTPIPFLFIFRLRPSDRFVSEAARRRKKGGADGSSERRYGVRVLHKSFVECKCVPSSGVEAFGFCGLYS